MKYIFIAGAPGSKWSSVAKNIYSTASVDSSDYSEDRTYYHSAWGEPQLMHLGVSWDPGMEFGKNFDRLNEFSREELEAEFKKLVETAADNELIYNANISFSPKVGCV